MLTVILRPTISGLTRGKRRGGRDDPLRDTSGDIVIVKGKAESGESLRCVAVCSERTADSVKRRSQSLGS